MVFISLLFVVVLFGCAKPGSTIDGRTLKDKCNVLFKL